MSSRPHMEARSESSFSQPPKSQLGKQPKQPPTSTSVSSSSTSSGFSSPAFTSKTSGSRILPSKEHGSASVATMNNEGPIYHRRIARVGSAKPKLCPRREFGPAQDPLPRQYSLRYTKSKSAGSSQSSSNSSPLLRKKDRRDALDSVLSTKVRLLSCKMTCQIDAVWHCLAYECFNLTTFSLQKHDGSSMYIVP